MSATTEELKPCPFCGAKASTAHGGKYAVCDTCDAAPSTLVRAELWNTRPTEESIAARVVALEEVVKAAETCIDAMNATIRLTHNSDCADMLFAEVESVIDDQNAALATYKTVRATLEGNA